MAAEMLLIQTLNDLSSEELDIFKSFLELEEIFPKISRRQLKEANRQDLVDLMMEAYSQPEWVEVTRNILKKMKRSDLEQRLSEDSSGTKETQQPTLTQRVETMTSVLELLLETLNDMTVRETQDLNQALLRQIHHHTPYQGHIGTDMEDTLFSMVKTFGQRSVIKTMEVLRKINRTDLMQRLSDKSSISKRKHPDDPSLSALIHKVATIAAVNELLLETLKDLDEKELKKFMQLDRITCFHRSLPFYPWNQLMTTHRVKIVDLMMEKYGQQSVEVPRDVLMDMNKMDLAQKLTETSSELKESSTETLDVKTTEEQCSALIQTVETMTSVIEQLLETLAGFSPIEIEHFKKLVLSEMYSHNYLNIEQITDVQDCVFYIVETYGQTSVEKTKEILEKMKKTDVVHRLSDISSGPKKITSENKPPPALIHKVATMAAVKQLLLETLNGLSEEELRIFNEFLQSSSQKVFLLRQTADRAEVVDLIMKAYGQQSVEVTKKIFMKMSRTDLVEQFSGTSSGLKDKNFWCEPESAQFERVPASHYVEQILWKTLDTLSYKELRRFMWSLQFMHFKKSIPHKSVYQRERFEATQLLVNLMMEKHGQQSVEVVREILKDMHRTDLVERLSKISSGQTGRRAELDSRHRGEGAFSRDPSDKDPSDWTKLDPEVNSTHTDEAPTYSLQSEVGNFECSVSGLRWSCKEKVSFKYQFCSWEEHMERMENMQYMPAGPLIDITLIVGKLAIVYLPHWICIDDDPRILDKFAVLHIDDCGDVVEKVFEVTSSHVKLSEPVFSPRAVLMKAGFPVKISCNVLIYYKPNTSFLKLHVYLIPHDPALKQTVDKNEFSQGYEIIRKPRPDKYLKMQKGFMLTADIDTAKIQPEKITLRYESQHPNFYEVFIENPDGNLCLTLSYSIRNKGEPKCEHVWTCEIQKYDYSTCALSGVAGSSSEALVVNALAEEKDGHCSAVIQKVRTTTPAREKLLKMLLQLNQEEFEEFKWYLQDPDIGAGLTCIPRIQLEKTNMLKLVDLIMQTYSQKSIEVIRNVFRKINRNDLVQMLSETSSGSQVCG